LYGSLCAVKVLLALLRSTLTVLAPPGRQARIDPRGASSIHAHDNRGADDKNFAWVSTAIQADSRCRPRKVTETSLLSEFKARTVSAMRPNDTERTRLSHEEWGDLILAEIKGKGRSRYYSAICPICLACYDADILSNDASARMLAVEKVASHIKRAHSDALT
jgi:hypothetical protein